MTFPAPPPLQGWAVILGASSGFGEAAALELAAAGMDIVGVHLDRRATLPNVERLRERIQSLGREARFYNVNAADPNRRAEVLDDLARHFHERSQGDGVRVLLHSLAFGTLRRLVEEDGDGINAKQMDMTLDVMAHSLVYWVQGLLARDLFVSEHGRVFAMTSIGASRVWKGYGAVSAAKAALEAHIRQLAVELAPRGITANALCAGVTETAALRKIPDAEAMKAAAAQKNPHHRITTPADVARALAVLAQPGTYWLTANTLYLDGGEARCG